jgi:DNA-binding MarR family transcriptional regulator
MSPVPPPPTADRTVDQLDDLGELLRENYIIIKRRQQAFLRSQGLSISEWSALQWCAGGAVRGGELAEAIGLTSAGVTDLADRLEARGLVRRLRDPDDRRAVRIELTEAGRRFQVEKRRKVAALLRELTAQLSSDEIRALSLGLHALNRIASAPEITPAPTA